MRIGMFTDAWLPTHDGTVTSIIKFRESLEQLGHDVFIFAPGDRTGVSPDDDRVFLFKGRVFKQYPDYKLAIAPSKWKTDMLLEHDIVLTMGRGKYGAMYFLAPSIEKNYDIFKEIWGQIGQKEIRIPGKPR